MFFASFVKLNNGRGPPSMGLMLISILLCLIISSPISAIIACTAAFVASMTAWVITALQHLFQLPFYFTCLSYILLLAFHELAFWVCIWWDYFVLSLLHWDYLFWISPFQTALFSDLVLLRLSNLSLPKASFLSLPIWHLLLLTPCFASSLSKENTVYVNMHLYCHPYMSIMFSYRIKPMASIPF